MVHTNELVLVNNQGWDERILVCRNGDLVDTFVIVTRRYVVLVDTLINPATARKMVAFAQPHLRAGRYLIVVNTHADHDHAWGNQLFAGPEAPFPAPILGSRRCAERLAGADSAAALLERQHNEPAIFGEVVLTPPTLRFDDTMSIDGGDLTIEFFPAPGHTADQIALFLPEINLLLAADAAELPFPFADSVAELPVMRATLAKLAARKPASALYCHAPVTLGPQLLQDNIDYFDRVEQQCRAAIRRGLPEAWEEQSELAALVDLPFAEAVPTRPEWQGMPKAYRTTGHTRQIKMMLSWLLAQA
ncbi:MAG TPA: MBL fold metallo-hydrolase [Caldilineaceae bacterium]|nr:MBL fold metallo-hydrolase [Caldilineaceae bacterium]